MEPTRFTVSEIDGLPVVEGLPNECIVERSQDIARVIEACISNRTKTVLLYGANLPPNFFDLSSGFAGDFLQKAQSFGLRVAIVAPRDAVRPSTHFDKILNKHLALFESREAALAWLAAGA